MTNEREDGIKEEKFLSRGTDHLGDLGAKLRDLQGFKTLAHELIQNADDANDATSMTFDIRDDALVVDNNGVFSDCGQVEDSDCPWKKDKGHKCDFHRFRIIAAGDKRGEEGTTGAFGIGFIAVYQITDCPELISGNRHWIIHEQRSENERIKVCQGCVKCNSSDLPGTRFILPWAFDSHSELRKALMADAVSQDGPDKLCKELIRSLPTAMLFLKRLDMIEVKRNGRCEHKFERMDDDSDNLIISNDNADEDRIWHLLHGDFSERAEILRAEHTQIEEKRSSKVMLAIPTNDAQVGLLCACLPTEHNTELPFHINADFFPTNDRKRIILSDDYQSKWNNAAISAAAQCLGDSIDLLSEILGHKGIWYFLKKVYDAKSEDISGKFWESIRPEIKTSKVIFTSTDKWVTSSEAVLLQNKEETGVLKILEAMGLNIVHEELRSYWNLLRSSAVGVQPLDISRICQAFTDLNMESGSWPPFLAEHSDRVLLWQEIRLLLERSQENQAEDEVLLKKIAIAPGRDAAPWCCEKLFTADDETVTLFLAIDETIPFVADDTHFDPLSKRLCRQFTVSDAIEKLSELGREQLTDRWEREREQFTLSQLFDWFEKQDSEILNDSTRKQRFISLSIFPSSGQLHKLSELSVPGGFEDSLGLAKLVDLTTLGNRGTFLRNLGMQELNFQTYAKLQLPTALKNQNIPPEKRRKAIGLLANRIGELKDDSEVREVLKKTPLVECTDGELHLAKDCYFNTQSVCGCLGEDVFFVVLPNDSQTTFRDLYEWIGVSDEPRYRDLVARVKEISESSYSSKRMQVVGKIFEHLGKRLGQEKELDELELDQLDPLKSITWLPAEGKEGRWYKPSELHTPYRKHLFESQSLFLGIPREIQNASSSFIKFLNINSEPTADLVIKHLLYCVNKGLSVNTEVYRFLNNKTDNPDLKRLKDVKCLHLETAYWSPNHVFWGEHRFGRYRRQLSEELREFNKLFQHIGVRDTPGHEDALKVLREISDEFGRMNKSLDDDTHDILLECWRMLEIALQSDPLSEDALRSLHGLKCVPNTQRLLTQPEFMFFENRAGLAEKFGEFLKDNVISRPLGAGRAMAVAGVRSLGSAVKVHILERTEPAEDMKVKDRILQRCDQLARVLKADKAISALDYLEKIHYVAVNSLCICYNLDAFNSHHKSKPETTPAFYYEEEKELLFMRRNGQVRWPAVARELAVALFPEEDPGRIASPLKDVLAADSVEDAECILNDLGFARLDTNVHQPSLSAPTVIKLGDDMSEAPAEKADSVNDSTEKSEDTEMNDIEMTAPEDSQEDYPISDLETVQSPSPKPENKADKLHSDSNEMSHDSEESEMPPAASPDELQKMQAESGSEQSSGIGIGKNEKPAFPESSSSNPERRKKKILELLDDAPRKEYQKHERSARTTRGSIDPDTSLRSQYKNEADQIICQICKEEMPFRKRNGEYYIEAVEALSRDYFPKEDEAQFLALCPLCAAMYQEFVKQDEGAMKSFKNTLMNSKEPEILLELGEMSTSIQFVETHWRDIKTILSEMG